MSEAGKPTPGVWHIEKYSDGSLQVHGNLKDVSDDDAEYSVIAEFVRSHEDASLIAEAGTVHHKTGLTPRQLLAQRDALLKQLQAATDALSGGLWDYGPGQDEHERCNEVIAECRAALALVKGETK